ncbi:alpha/beta hydrolase family protein [Corynebacterium felinum]|uniref:S-formylglutathione hydrolase FrmB n=1 Tax=Corynebacterium felinum TaxID=131318 RepID=A0ABU2B4G1_9CORY|nr:alpha/beta hydrolase family protein [Corynebacterium felinum]MDF5821404.1 alpha/beta hydrolase family protein [Corynebacterium felinum]MDR7353506.1 S-formylglutathione hydrolase FrmB [Corynebacterium felinum]WJY95685.1 Diacylglycerol acyltransferase/mycolyltransferase Ag85B precursor [Corynebacterium felinum]
MKLKKFKAVLACSIVASVGVFGAAPAYAGSSEDELVLSGSTQSLFQNLVTSLANSPSSSGARVDRVLGFFNALGSSGDRRLPGPLTSSDSDYPKATDVSITSVELVKRESDPYIDHPRVERWFVASAAMQRVIPVSVLLPADADSPAPHVYLLDGISATDRSGWLRHAKIHEKFADEQAMFVMPLEANGSLYADWNHHDPALGLMKWETFLSKELPQVMEANSNFNGKRAIGGLSMGGGSAVRTAAKHPDVFHATFGLSGCYSTVDPIGLTITNIMVRSRGGNPANMWDEQQMRENDLTLNPEGLKDMPIYLFTADGMISERDKELTKNSAFYVLPAGSVLEQGTHFCTQKLEQAMIDHGMTHQKVVYQVGGVHDWDLFNTQIVPAWEYVKPFVTS